VITPSLVLLLLLSKILFNLIQKPQAESFLNGLRSALVALILLAAYSLSQAAMIDIPTVAIFILLLAASLIKQISPLYYIAAGAILGLIFFPY
jgi:chromate transport protein ChrA